MLARPSLQSVSVPSCGRGDARVLVVSAQRNLAREIERLTREVEATLQTVLERDQLLAEYKQVCGGGGGGGSVVVAVAAACTRCAA